MIVAGGNLGLVSGTTHSLVVLPYSHAYMMSVALKGSSAGVTAGSFGIRYSPCG